MMFPPSPRERTISLHVNPTVRRFFDAERARVDDDDGPNHEEEDQRAADPSELEHDTT